MLKDIFSTNYITSGDTMITAAQDGIRLSDAPMTAKIRDGVRTAISVALNDATDKYMASYSKRFDDLSNSDLIKLANSRAATEFNIASLPSRLEELNYKHEIEYSRWFNSTKTWPADKRDAHLSLIKSRQECACATMELKRRELEHQLDMLDLKRARMDLKHEKKRDIASRKVAKELKYVKSCEERAFSMMEWHSVNVAMTALGRPKRVFQTSIHDIHPAHRSAVNDWISAYPFADGVI